MADLYHPQHDLDQWVVMFTSDTNNWEVDLFSSFYNKLHAYTVDQNSVVKLLRTPSRRGVFGVVLL